MGQLGEALLLFGAVLAFLLLTAGVAWMGVNSTARNRATKEEDE